MKKLIFVTILCCFALVNSVWANQTRMGILMAGDYLDDVTNINIYPQQITTYRNGLYGDITSTLDDYGIIISPVSKYGALACWQNATATTEFYIGYAITLFNFDIGIAGSPVKDNLKFGFGIGRTFFNRRIDLSFHGTDTPTDGWYKFNLRITKRKGDFAVVPKYALDYVRVPDEYNRHRIGLVLQRLILNEGFVYLGAEYDFTRGDIQNDYTNVYAGLEVPLGRRVALLLGVKEIFINGFESPQWFVEPGISIRIREFTLDFHINEERLFDRYTNFINSFGLELRFGRF